MKKNSYFNISAFICIVAMLLFSNQAQAQDWIRGKVGIHSVGVGGAMGIAVVSGSGYTASGVSTAGFSINASGEYRVHDYVGVGWQTGLNLYPSFGVTVIEIPIVAQANFHILEAISGASSIRKNLDVYGGLQFGGGPAFSTGKYSSGVFGVIHVGPQVGVRYWVGKNIAVFGQFGWGNTFANAGVTF